METINSLVPIFLLNALWQATLVAGVAAFFCAWLMRKVHSARNRHALWVAALLLSVGLPLLSTTSGSELDRKPSIVVNIVPQVRYLLSTI